MKLFEFIQKALSEADGHPSSIRLYGFWTIFFLILALAFGFVYTVLNYEGIVIAFAGILAALVSGVLGIKVWQKDKENSQGSTGTPQ